MSQRLENQLLILWPSAKPGGYWTVRRGRRFGYVASIGLPNHESPFISHFSPITSHGRASGLARVVFLSRLKLNPVPCRLDLPPPALRVGDIAKEKFRTSPKIQYNAQPEAAYRCSEPTTKVRFSFSLERLAIVEPG
jgi:hypothetical protein